MQVCLAAYATYAGIQFEHGSEAQSMNYLMQDGTGALENMSIFVKTYFP